MPGTSPGMTKGIERKYKKGGSKPPFFHAEAQDSRHAAREEPPVFL